MFDFAPVVFGASSKGWYDRQPITPDDYKRCCFHSQKRVGDIGFLSNIIENHDEPRGVSHYIPEGEVSVYSKKMLAVMYFMLKGLPFIYQGQEIGMENMKFSSIDQIDDISTIDEYHVALNAGCSQEEALKCISVYSRDNARTPMQWDCTENSGFTSGTPWLSVNPNYHEINVKSQQNDPDSLLSFYKKLTALRKDPDYKETIVYGDLIPYLEDQHNLMAYFRKGEKTLLVIGNFQTEPQDITFRANVKRAAEQLSIWRQIFPENILHLKNYQAVILEL